MFGNNLCICLLDSPKHTDSLWKTIHASGACRVRLQIRTVLQIFLSYFSYEWELPFHMSLSTQYTVVVCFGNLKLEYASVPGSGAIIIPLSEKTRFLRVTVCRFVHHYNYTQYMIYRCIWSTGVNSKRSIFLSLDFLTSGSSYQIDTKTPATCQK